ncbi:MAG: transporter substrate-binding domain-containing protein [Candidatus Lokiarchaeota archaeon]|nr:transporter substrate-binding domain-containing protein [Candidatus Harpocratesius repetitus]
MNFVESNTKNQSLSIRVGYYENSPKIYKDKEKGITGFFPDLLTYIASQENWNIIYVEGSWSEGLARLNSSEIDIMPDVGYSAERDKIYDFNNISAITSWARIYTLEKSDIESIIDLEQKRIAVMRDDIDYIGPMGIKQLTNDYSINCTYIEFSNYTEVFEAIEKKSVDAGVINELYGNRNGYRYAVTKTQIVFSPVNFHFGFPKNATLNQILINKIDYWLNKLKNDPHSFYYEKYQEYFAEIPPKSVTFPYWILYIALGLSGAVIFFGGTTIFLRYQVSKRTKELHESETRFRSVIDSMKEWIWEIDKNGIFIYVGPQIFDVLGYHHDEILGKPFSFLLPKKINKNTEEINNNDEDERLYSSDSLIEMLYAGSKPKSINNLEHIKIHKNGQRRIVESTIIPLYDRRKNFIGFRGIDRDITELRKTQEFFLQSQKMKAIGQLAAGIAHEFNNIMTIILGFTSLLKDDISKKTHDEYIHEISLAGNQAAALTKQLLSFSKKYSKSTISIDINEIIKSMELMIKKLVGEKILIIIKYQENISQFLGEVQKIQQIILNLVINARDAMPNGGILSIESSEITKNKEKVALNPKYEKYIKINITDTGKGMSKEQLTHIFEPFYTTKPKGKGTGLGMYIVYGIVQQFNGTIDICSKIGKGTRISLYFPSINQKTNKIITTHQELKDISGKERILLVEDDPKLCSLIEKILLDFGYQVRSFIRPRDALQVFESYQENSTNHEVQFDLIITDIVMPELSGNEMIDLIYKKFTYIPVIYISGYSKHSKFIQSILNDGTHFLKKPFTPYEIGAKIRQVLDNN